MEMKTRIPLVAFAALAFAGSVLGGPPHTGEGPRASPQTPVGFTGQYLLIEKKDGAFVVLQKPEVRSLVGKPYLVGRTMSLPGITNDELFAPTVQWIGLEDVKRMGETDSDIALIGIREIAERKQR